jgi:hypothetical protein
MKTALGRANTLRGRLRDLRRNYFFASPVQWGQHIPLASASPPHLGHFTLQVACRIEASHFEQTPVQSAILTSAPHLGHSTLNSPTWTSFPHLHRSVMSEFMSALHLEQCIAIIPDARVPVDEHPHVPASPSATRQTIIVLMGQVLSTGFAGSTGRIAR